MIYKWWMFHIELLVHRLTPEINPLKLRIAQRSFSRPLQNLQRAFQAPPQWRDSRACPIWVIIKIVSMFATNFHYYLYIDIDICRYRHRYRYRKTYTMYIYIYTYIYIYWKIYRKIYINICIYMEEIYIIYIDIDIDIDMDIDICRCRCRCRYMYIHINTLPCSFILGYFLGLCLQIHGAQIFCSPSTRLLRGGTCQ